ncbi:sporulation integral membrane protein YtvI [Aquibacillus sp. 3ASR75-11]|uniref:Sporulation integral membrane protein YtvI n=1 Tax=Terrihalobacillus insolitus TaxID=2950438 RepID=A0A9X3WR25_9BACI|nr:sporulation integral membrane protein YtvI [Terrihalobacillus insolitus]MDC3412803.1 sporulation integral membrane protein YtvI [Terrihalobacillus insolitus]MDC3423720.1 sporulation integral membrane protein YtvI [Terrihalobacillus insolitus]
MFRYLSKRQWILILLSVLLILIGYFILPVSVPLILAFITALFLNPSIRWVQFRFRLNRKVSVIIIFLLFLIVLSVIGTYVVTRVVTQMINFTENAPSYVTQLNAIFAQWESDLNRFTKDLPKEFVVQLTQSIKDNIDALSELVKDRFRINKIASAAAQVPQYLVSLLVYMIALFLFMLEIPRLKTMVYEHLTDETAEKVQFMNARLAYVILGFLKAQFLVSIIIFVVSLVGLLIIAPEFAVIMSLIIWIIDFIPIIGSIIILGPWAIYMFLAGDITAGTQLSVLALLLLGIRRTVEPKVMGRHIGLSPLATLIGMYIGLQLFGVIGFVLGPLLVIAFNSAKEAGIIKWDFKI